MKKYQKIQEAIGVKNKELQEIYDIEKSAFALAALIELQKQKKFELDEEIDGLRKELEGRIEKTKFAWDKEQIEYDETLKERNVQEKKERERQKEEYTYAFEREKQLAENKFKDEVNKQTKELALKKEEFDKKIDEQDKAIKERETSVAEREKCLDDLQKEVDSFPKIMESAVSKAVEEITVRLKAEANKNEMLLKSESRTPFLHKSVSLEGFLLTNQDGCKVNTVAEAFPVALDIVRLCHEERPSVDEAGKRMKELRNFKIHLSNVY